MTFTLGDDGTLDTVLTCDKCGTELRFHWDGEHYEACIPPICSCHDQFVEWATEDAEATHECGECSGPATCVDHSEAYAESQEG